MMSLPGANGHTTLIAPITSPTTDPDIPPAYTSTQLSIFENFIGLPSHYHHTSKPSHTLAYLTSLHIHTISTIPYENLSLHYSPTRHVDLEPQHLWQKLIGDGRGRGGYCMENSIFMNHVLRGLGFKVYLTGVKIRLRQGGVPGGAYIGWTHIVNIVTLPDSTSYMIDIGFGGDGATKPIPLIPGQITQNLGAQQVRLIRDHIPGQLHRTQSTKMWIYQYRNGEAMPWNSFYAFSDAEFSEADFKVMNWYTSTHQDSFQRFCALVVKFLRRKSTSGHEEIYGKRMLVANVVKENLGGKTVVIESCNSEFERVKALKKWFEMQLSKEEISGIIGHWSELRPDQSD